MSYQETFYTAVTEGDLVKMGELRSQYPELALDYPLILAAQEGHLEAVKYLISEGGDLHTQADQPLIRAATEGHLDVVAYLLSLGADIHAGDGMSLLNAAIGGHQDVIRLFHQHSDTNMDIILTTSVNEDILKVTRYLLGKEVKAKKGTTIDACHSQIALECFLDMVKEHDRCNLTTEAVSFLRQREEIVVAVKSKLLELQMTENMAATISRYY